MLKIIELVSKIIENIKVYYFRALDENTSLIYFKQ